MRKLTKHEIFSIVIIFMVLIGISVPNFVASLRRARDQVRKDDMGALDHALQKYFEDFRAYPLASSDSRIMACKNPSDKVEIDNLGKLIVDFIPCNWGADGILDLTPGSDKVYMRLLPREPNYQKGINYQYFSDGRRFQIFVALEGKNDDEYDQKIIERNILCGNIVCNAGRASGCPTSKTIKQCEDEAL